jgi:precorrin-6B methylase 2
MKVPGFKIHIVFMTKNNNLLELIAIKKFKTFQNYLHRNVQNLGESNLTLKKKNTKQVINNLFFHHD